MRMYLNPIKRGNQKNVVDLPQEQNKVLITYPQVKKVVAVAIMTCFLLSPPTVSQDTTQHQLGNQMSADSQRSTVREEQPLMSTHFFSKPVVNVSSSAYGEILVPKEAAEVNNQRAKAKVLDTITSKKTGAIFMFALGAGALVCLLFNVLSTMVGLVATFTSMLSGYIFWLESKANEGKV